MYKIIGLITLFFSLSINATDLLKKISVADLDKLLSKKGKEVYLFDANVESTRIDVGIIPGAKFVSSSEKYDLKKDLPVNLESTLVFYCANAHCTASHLAARKAISFGYKNVSVMTDGIFGWKKAGKKLEYVKASAQADEVLANAIHEVTPQMANSIVEKKQGIIIDVREGEERQYIINGALWFPMSKANNSLDWTQFVSSLPKGKKIIFHCAAGFRSKKLAEKILAEGHDAAYFKGIDQWREAGLPLITGPLK